jgi:protein tyrosine phosphatase (PTP) superfamily phosphohydrolase (DUF442 family)
MKSSIARFRTVTIVFIVVAILGGGIYWAVAVEYWISPPALTNFGRVTHTLYRGAQPSPEGFRSLRQMGVTIDVNFRDGDNGREKQEVESLGMKYVGIPWKASHGPSTDQVVEFLNMVRDNPGATIFVHCREGADRTGTMIAAYRIAVEHESTGDAVSEMRRYHYFRFWLPQLQRYVDSLPQLLRTDPRFSAYAADSISVQSGAVPMATGITPAIR